jgi:hypothetical protein
MGSLFAGMPDGAGKGSTECSPTLFSVTSWPIDPHHSSPYSAVVPPSMTSSLPVTYDDSSEARYSMP